MRRTTLLFAGIALVASAAYSGEGHVRRNPRRIPGRYIVALESGVDTAAVANNVRNLKGGKVRNTYERGFKGLALEMSDEDAVELSKDARVQFIEEDATVTAAAIPWGLDRVDQRFLPLNGTYVSSGSGAGVNVYVVDTGILASHSDFGGRVAAGFNAVADDNGSSDCNGHGTHVAGVVGGSTYGVAKAATLIPVRVLDCSGSGSISTVLAGLEWVIDDYARSGRPAVVNMSLGGDASSAVDSAVNRAIAAGMTVVVAAGNSNTDACATSPARVAAALTVGASTETDQRAGFSNYGACVDLFAPGSNIVSAWYSSASASGVSSGTSAAAPFVAGAAALSLQQFPNASPAAVAQTLVSQATADILSGIGAGSPNRLLFARVGTLDQSIQSDSQLLGDPSFEYGSTFWSSDICTVVNPAGCPPGELDGGWSSGDFVLQSVASRSGIGHASLGGKENSVGLRSEVVTVPLMIRRAELSLYLWVITKGKKKTAEDVLTVEVRNSAGVLLETLGTFSNLDASPMYVQRRFDMTRYRGASVRISFTAREGKGAASWFLMDDVTLNVWR